MGVGVSFRQFERTFDLGYQHDKLQGREFWTGDNGEWLSVELEGPSQDLEVARITVDTLDVDVGTVFDALVLFLGVVLPGREMDAIDWVSENVERAVGDAVATSYGRKLLGLEYLGRYLTLTVEAR